MNKRKIKHQLVAQ